VADAGEEQRDQDRGKRQHHVADPHDQRIEAAADVAGEEPEADADDERQQHRRAADEERDARAEHQRREDIAALLVGAEQVLGRAALHPRRRQHRIAQLERRQVERIVRRDDVGEQRSDEAKQRHDRGADRGRRASKRMPEVAVEKAGPATRSGRRGRGLGSKVSPRRRGVAAGRGERSGVAYLDFNVIHLKYM